MKTQMAALKQWATDNNIPLQCLMFVGDHGFAMHKGMFTSDHSTTTAPATTTQTN